ncbi:MAG: complex I NDUFA9 subunit family protein [Geminicoccaceae bacterium]
MAIKQVTIFGGSGFLGRYVVRRLAAKGIRLRVCCRQPKLAMHLKPMGDVGQISLEHCDLAVTRELGKFLQGSDAVVNLVGILYEGGRQTFRRLQAEAPGDIADAAKTVGIERMVQMSAIGAAPEGRAIYAQTKAEGERAVLAVLPGATILRPSVVFGAEDEFFNRFAKLTAVSPFLPLVGGGNTKFQPVYVDNVAEAVVRCLEDPGTAGKIYELGGPKTYSFREILEYLLVVLRKRRLLLPLPFGAARLQAWFLEWLPSPPLTRDQVTMLKSDNVVAEDALTLKDLGIEPTPLEAIVPAYLSTYARRKLTAA